MPKFAANLTTMFQEVEFLDRFKAAANAGFKAVEFLFPYDYEIEAIKNQLDMHRLKLVLFNLYPGDFAGAERGIAALPNRRAEFNQSVTQALEYAKALNCPRLHCMSGLIANDMNKAPNDKAQCQKLYIENLKHLSIAAKPFNIDIMVEALNPQDMPNYLVNTQEQSLDIIQQVAMDNVKIQFDIYHCQMSQGNVAARLQKLLPHIGHIQIADVPGRHEPNSGEINFEFLFKHLDDIGYQGQIGCEYFPRTTTLAGLNWLFEV